jgi:hypothetical protein
VPRPGRIAWFAVAGVLLFAEASAAAGGPQPVLASPLDEKQPAAAGPWLAWAQNNKATPNRFDVFARRDGGRRHRVNPRGTHALMGGIDGTTLVYQLLRGRGSDVAFYDVRSRRRLRTPSTLATRGWEWDPTISGNDVLFGRGRPQNHAVERRVVLYDRSTSRALILATTAGGAYSVVPGQVNGDYAVYWQCFRVCNVFRYQISTARRIHVPNNGRQEYAPSVTPSGTVYFARSGFGCGTGVRLFRFAGGRVTPLAAFPAGVDVGRTFATTNGHGRTIVLFDRIHCSPARYDVYELVDPG